MLADGAWQADGQALSASQSLPEDINALHVRWKTGPRANERRNEHQHARSRGEPHWGECRFHCSTRTINRTRTACIRRDKQYRREKCRVRICQNCYGSNSNWIMFCPPAVTELSAYTASPVTLHCAVSARMASQSSSVFPVLTSVILSRTDTGCPLSRVT